MWNLGLTIPLLSNNWDSLQCKMNINAANTTKTLTTTTALTDTKSAKISIYPNPVTDNLTIELPKGMNNARISIYAIDGQMVAAQSAVSAQQVVNVSALSSGCYTIKVTSANQSFTQKFIKK